MRIRMASHSICRNIHVCQYLYHMCGNVQICTYLHSKCINFASHVHKCAHSHHMSGNACICEHLHSMCGNVCICVHSHHMRRNVCISVWGSLGGFTNIEDKAKTNKIYLFVYILPLPVTYIYCQVSSVVTTALLYQSSRKQHTYIARCLVLSPLHCFINPAGNNIHILPGV